MRSRRKKQNVFVKYEVVNDYQKLDVDVDLVVK